MRDLVKMHTAQHNWYVRVVIPRREKWLKDNGPCVKCGSSKNLEVDHRDPKKKVHHSIWTWSDKRREAELKKCQVLCRKCHKKKSSEECRRRMLGVPNLACRKLEPRDVRRIRGERRLSNRKLAALYGVGSTTISGIKTRLVYKQVV